MIFVSTERCFIRKTTSSKRRTLFAAWRILLRLPKSFDEVIGEFRDQHGYSVSDGDFIKWLKRNYPAGICRGVSESWQNTMRVWIQPN